MVCLLVEYFHDDTLETGFNSPPDPLGRFGTSHFTVIHGSIVEPMQRYQRLFRGSPVREAIDEQRENRRKICRNYLIQLRIKRRRELAETFANLRT